jgi:sterol desaturase/sphingolipid hydroxylase (fatty acid hydroxylase superfamily)
VEEILRDNEATILFVGMVAALFIAAIAEAVLQRRPETDTTRRRWLNNISLTLINQASVNVLSLAVTIMIAGWGIEAEIGILRQSGISFWPMLLLAIFTFELISYWFHRALHAFPILWRLHAVHHSDTEVDVTTTYRNHPLELYINAPLTIPVILMLGFPVAVVTAYQLLKTTINIFAHSNVRLPAGLDRALRFVVITPDFHRLHHCSERVYTDSNFSAAFPIYDYVFGTAKWRPYDEQETMKLGLEYFRDPVDSRLDRLLLMPFVWRSREGRALQRGQYRPSWASKPEINPGPRLPLWVKVNSEK